MTAHPIKWGAPPGARELVAVAAGGEASSDRDKPSVGEAEAFLHDPIRSQAAIDPTIGSAMMKIPMPPGSGSTTVSSVTIYESRAGILATTERKKYLSSGAGLAAIFRDYLA
jgi:hypothetical protein